MTREDAVATVSACVATDTAVVACNGHISRVLHAVDDRPGNFYMIGSMGIAPSIALGICLARPGKHVAVFDGDGNVLMGLGNLASVGARPRARLTHFCFDNGSHASTGGQPTISDRVDLAAVASAAGYRWARTANGHEDLAELAREALAHDGPAFLLVKVEPGGLPAATARVALSPQEMTARMKRALEPG